MITQQKLEEEGFEIQTILSLENMINDLHHYIPSDVKEVRIYRATEVDLISKPKAYKGSGERYALFIRE